MPPVPPVEEQSLEQILHNVEPKLKRVLWRHRIPLQDADDLLQETFLIMVSKSGTIRNPEAWLLATLANRCIIYWRKHRSRLWDLVDSTILELLAEAETPDQERSDLRADLDTLLSELPDRCRSVLRLRYGLGCSTAEAAERTGYRQSSIRKVTHRCLAALSERLLGARFQRQAQADAGGSREPRESSAAASEPVGSELLAGSRPAKPSDLLGGSGAGAPDLRGGPRRAVPKERSLPEPLVTSAPEVGAKGRGAAQKIERDD
ncbi:MAG TPA: sigma-70 family RNA polymerase sigma factor [Thermoanaerobaculia bacterium]|nr:sigma-70 family RNA polymerase sigma factor [Thermoanaerobaculia bacterium]